MLTQYNRLVCRSSIFRCADAVVLHGLWTAWKVVVFYVAQTISSTLYHRGNCCDNAAMESFFGTLKAEFYYLNKFDNLDELEVGISDYIRYYNHDRIKLKSQGMSPVKYRTQFGQP